MTRSESLSSSGALEAVRRLAGPSAAVVGAARLEGGQHADTWRVDTEDPAISVVVRQFPVGDPAPLYEQRVLQALDGLGGLTPVPLGADLDGGWSQYPTSLISRLDGQADITPTGGEQGSGLPKRSFLSREKTSTSHEYQKRYRTRTFLCSAANSWAPDSSSLSAAHGSHRISEDDVPDNTVDAAGVRFVSFDNGA